MTTIRLFLFALALLLVPANGQAYRDMVVYCEYPPPTKVVKGSKGGLIYDQVWEIMRRADIPGPIEQVTWKRGWREATTEPNVALFPTTRTKEREKLFSWIGPILRLEWVFYKHVDSNIEINSLDDARKVKAIGTYTNDAKEQWLKARGFANLVSVRENLTNLKKLYRKRIDLMVGSPSVTDRWPAMHNMQPGIMKHAYTFKTVDLYLAVSRGSNPRKIKRMQEAFKAMLKDGAVPRLYEKWVPGLKPPKLQ